MITNFETTNVLNAQIMGLSTDTKPTTGVQPNSLFWELDTNGMYFFDGTQWQPIGGSGGGGGESDFSTAQVTINNGNGLVSLEIAAYVDYPSDNPNSSNDMTYNANFVIGDTQSSSPPTIDSTQTITLLTYQNEGMINWPIYGNNESLDTVTAASVNITGNAELVTGGEYDHILVTGDCELTITWS